MTLLNPEFERVATVEASGPMAWTMITVGFVGVPIMLWLDGRQHHIDRPDVRSRRAA